VGDIYGGLSKNLIPPGQRMSTSDGPNRKIKLGWSMVSRRLGQLRRDQKGATAVEFALLALPFFALLFAILETALLFFVGELLDTSVAESARLIRTGQAQEKNFDAEDFRGAICDAMVVMLSCEANLKIDVRTPKSFASADLSSPVTDGELDDKDFGYDDGHGGEIVVVRAFYEWPTFMRFYGQDFATLANGNHLLAATATFRNEPFPW
jgi:Flp pilus assembly protein TadG